MRSTNIQHLVGLKKTGHDIIFLDCPQCKRFFGTNEPDIESCSVACEIRYAFSRHQFETDRKNRLNTFLLSKACISNEKKI